MSRRYPLKISHEELKAKQEMSLRDKIDTSMERIEQWYDHWQGNIYVAFSGGKDSSVLLDLTRRIFPEIPAVYNDTGLEYPEVKEHIKTFPNVIITRPKLTYRQVIEKYGFAVISKEQSRYLWDMRVSKSEKLKSIRMNGNRWGRGKISKKWLFLLNAPFKISGQCCEILKKNPAKVYERKTHQKAMIGSMVEESMMRAQTYMRFGCNAYETKRPISTPLAFWKKQDVLQYIVDRNLTLPSVYGSIQTDENGELYTTGVDRTGCIWCLFGIEQEKNSPNRMQRLKVTHPKIYNYCINNLGLGEVLDFLEVDYE